jgi:UDP-glucose 4-epimerase
MMLKWMGRIYGINYVIFRYFNVCGSDESGEIGDSKKPSQLLVQNAVRGAMGIEPFFLTCGKVDTPDGTPIRDQIDVSDLATAHLRAYEYLTEGGQSDVFNLGNGTGYSVLEIVKKVEEIFHTEIPRKQGEARKGEYAKIYADITKAKEKLGWKPIKTLEESVLNLKKWYTKHPNGYDF